MEGTPPGVTDMMLDARLSADARVLGFHIARKGEEGSEIPLEEFQDVLSADAGAARVRRAVKQLERYGWIDRSAGGRGHSDSFVFRVAQIDSLTDRVPHGGNLNADSLAHRANLSAAPSSGTTSPSTTTSERGRTGVKTSALESDLEQLREFLGEHSAAADLFDRSANHSATWAGAIYGAFGPKATRERIWNGLPPDERPPALAAAIQDYAGEGKPYNNRLFEGYLRGEVERRKEGENGRSGNRNNRAGTGQRGRAGGEGRPGPKAGPRGKAGPRRTGSD